MPSEGQRGAHEGKMMARVNDICNFVRVNPEKQAVLEPKLNEDDDDEERASSPLQIPENPLLLLLSLMEPSFFLSQPASLRAARSHRQVR